MMPDDYFSYICPKCEDSIEVEMPYAPWEDGEETDVVCKCGYRMKMRCKCTYTHTLVAEIDGYEYDVTDQFSDDFDEAHRMLTGRMMKNEEIRDIRR